MAYNQQTDTMLTSTTSITTASSSSSSSMATSTLPAPPPSSNATPAQLNAAELFATGRSSWQDAWDAELAGDSNLATAKFERALTDFQQACELDATQADYAKYARLAEYKLQGNSAFNQGLYLQEEGNRQMEMKNYVDATVHYVKALKHFKKAAQVHSAEAARFTECANFVRDTLSFLKLVVRYVECGSKDTIVRSLSNLVQGLKNVEMAQGDERNIDLIFDHLIH